MVRKTIFCNNITIFKILLTVFLRSISCSTSFRILSIVTGFKNFNLGTQLFARSSINPSNRKDIRFESFSFSSACSCCVF